MSEFARDELNNNLNNSKLLQSKFPKDKLLEIWSNVKVAPGVLYVVGTPIGNLGDFSIRSLSILQQVDTVLAEDTRTSALLISQFDIKPFYISFHQHNYASKIDQIINLLKQGNSVAQISDAGMPAISDPGAELVDRCLEEKIEVRVVPGPSASVSILSLSGLDTSDFRFIGFLPQKKSIKENILNSLVNYSGITIFYEAPHRLLNTLRDLIDAGFGCRQLVIGRELTKEYEEVLRDTVDKIYEHFKTLKPKGEFVFVLDKASAEEINESVSEDYDALQILIRNLYSQGKSSKSILLELEDKTEISKNKLKKLIQQLKPIKPFE